MTIKILLLGSGGREHALATALQQDPFTEALYCAPGNPGIAQIVQIFPLDISDPVAVLALSQKLSIDLVVIGPELPLIHGVADALAAAGIACFGPTRSAAQIESSKEFAKEIMAKAGVATARYLSCIDEAQVREACSEFGPPYVVKDDALAAGKGVVVTDDLDQAIAHARSSEISPMRKVVVEEFLAGREFSLFAICDGETFLLMDPAQDYKRVADNDQGLNTGGMGAYSPLSWVSDADKKFVAEKVIKPVLEVMKSEGYPFIGVLYAGLIKTGDGIKVIEFNARFGDPETQALIPRLKTPLAKLLYAAATKRLIDFPALEFSDLASVALVLAAQGYPAHPELNRPIQIPGSIEADFIFHAGTKEIDGTLYNSGGRVLNVVGLGKDLESAREVAYQGIAQIKLEGSFYRSDIARGDR
jgi:phosphoribosylamine--glycine ligase